MTGKVSSEAALRTAEELREQRLRSAELAAELAETDYELEVIRARVERGLIKRVKGEKALAPTAEDRNRIFTLALDADEDYRARRKAGAGLRLTLQKAKAEIGFLRDKLRIQLAAMESGDHG